MIKVKYLLPVVLMLTQFFACAHAPQNKATDKTIDKSMVVESPQWWYQQGAMKVKELAEQPVFPKHAKNIILFIGDGMKMTPVIMNPDKSIEKTLAYYMGKNTPERQKFIIQNLYIEDNIIDNVA